MAVRLSRPQQVERNRDLVIAAARAVFTESGYSKATLEAIAERAGFSKGVVYSQFESKADLFLVLLERRIRERAEENRALAATLGPEAAITTLLQVAERDASDGTDWQRVLIEFRVHASRDVEVNRRYAALHARTVEMLAEVLEGLYERARLAPPAPARTLAEFVLAVGNGTMLERTAADGALPTHALIALVTRALGLDGRTS